MIDIESKIIAYHEDANDYRLCLTREEIEEIKNYEDWGEEYSKLADIYAKKCREVRSLQKEIKQIRAEFIDGLFKYIGIRMSHLQFLAEEDERKNNHYQAHYHRGGLWELGNVRDALEQLKEQNK